MATPVLTPTTQEFTAVRLYTEFDPYLYSVDNRPLQDLADNAVTLAQAVDSARSNQVVEGICDAAMNAGIVGFDTHLIGLNATNPSPGVLSLSPAVFMVKAPVSVGDSREVLKKASAPMTTLANVTHPVVLAKEIKYLVQIRYRDFAEGDTFPGYDSDNPFSPAGISNGWLEIGVVAGAQADTGTSVAPVPTSGWTPVYEVLARAGETTVTISPATSSVERTDKVLQAAELSLAAFENSKSSNGYQKLPNGLIMQWGGQSVAPAGANATFPIAFPTGALSVTATAQNVTEGVVSATTGTLTSTTVSLRHDSASTETIRWLAIGH